MLIKDQSEFTFSYVYFDQALIELANEFQLVDHINIICLPPPGFVSNQQNCFASGWGNSILIFTFLIYKTNISS